MYRQIFAMMIIVSFCVGIFAQPQDVPLNKPDFRKQPPSKITSKALNSTPATAPEEMPKNMSQEDISAEIEKLKNRRMPKEVGVVYIHPPYIQGWVQPINKNNPAWISGTGYLATAEVQISPNNSYPTGKTFHSSGSYGYGKASSRCWVKISFTPMKTGNYHVQITSWQKGYLQAACGYNSQVFAYRTLGLYIEGLGYQSTTLQEIYLNIRTQKQVQPFNSRAVSSKTFYLYKNRTYNIWAYTELGGWSAGDNRTWQTVNAACYLGPFMIKGIDIK